MPLVQNASGSSFLGSIQPVTSQASTPRFEHCDRCYRTFRGRAPLHSRRMTTCEGSHLEPLDLLSYWKPLVQA